MDEILNTLTSNNLYIAISGLILIFLIFVILKKLLKIAILVSFVIVVYFGYLYYTGKEMPITTNDIKGQIKEFKDKAKEKVKETMEEQTEKIKDKIDNVVGE